MNATETRQQVLDAEANKAAELVEREAIFRELEYDAAWEASQQTRQENEGLQKIVAAMRQERDTHSIKSYGYLRLSNIVKRGKGGAITRDEAWAQLVDTVAEINERVENVGK